MFSTTSEYALRALVQLSRQSAGVSVLGQDLAQRANIPPNYLSKILWTLRNAGFWRRRVGMVADTGWPNRPTRSRSLRSSASLRG